MTKTTASSSSKTAKKTRTDSEFPLKYTFSYEDHDGTNCTASGKVRLPSDSAKELEKLLSKHIKPSRNAKARAKQESTEIVLSLRSNPAGRFTKLSADQRAFLEYLKSVRYVPADLIRMVELHIRRLLWECCAREISYDKAQDLKERIDALIREKSEMDYPDSDEEHWRKRRVSIMLILQSLANIVLSIRVKSKDQLGASYDANLDRMEAAKDLNNSINVFQLEIEDEIRGPNPAKRRSPYRNPKLENGDKWVQVVKSEDDTDSEDTPKSRKSRYAKPKRKSRVEPDTTRVKWKTSDPYIISTSEEKRTRVQAAAADGKEKKPKKAGSKSSRSKRPKKSELESSEEESSSESESSDDSSTEGESDES